jgi:hypothetical protein
MWKFSFAAQKPGLILAEAELGNEIGGVLVFK